MAQGGTLFLDELGELSQSVQAKLLKCLEDKEIFHLGGLKPIKINCTVIAATNVDLVDQVNHKRFRQDLYFRLNTFTLTLPPLRRRPEDILELTMFFLEKYNNEYGMERRISSRGLERLQSYPFPGNVRELKNAIKKSVVMSETNLMDTVLDATTAAMTPRGGAMAYPVSPEDGKQSFDEMVMAFEKELLIRTISHCTTTRAIASHLGMTQSQVMRKLKKHDLSKVLKANKRMK
jgi:transcriptional regulator with PAS, ATPase and Fis domain